MKSTSGAKPLSRLEVLNEIEDVIRSMPPRDRLDSESDEVLEWHGRATAVIERWGNAMAIAHWRMAHNELHQLHAFGSNPGAKLVMILHQARNDLRMETIGPVNLAIGKGYVFDYHDSVRKIIEQSRSDLLFVDRYLNGEFVSKFLAYVSDGVVIRLLAWDHPSAGKNLATLVESAKAFSQQHGAQIAVRAHRDIHDRYVFVDGRAAFSSGPSFKDGPTTAGATIVEQSGSTLQELIRGHQALWDAATVKLP